MPTTDGAGNQDEDRFHLTLEELERRVRVPLSEQVASQPGDQEPVGSDYDEQRRQLRLAGGM